MANFFDLFNPLFDGFQLGSYGFDDEESFSKVPDQPIVQPREAQGMTNNTATEATTQSSHTERLAKKLGLTVEQFLALEEQSITPRNTDNVVTLFPSWSDDQRCAPNEILRSSLFAVLRKGERSPFQSKLITSWGNDEIYFTGIQLDQYDLDVWLQCLHLYRKNPLGNKVYFTLTGFLRALGKTSSGSNIKALKQSFDRLQAGGLKLRNGSAKKSYAGSLIEKYYEDEEIGMWCLIINPDLLPLFSHETTYLNWEIRKSLSGPLSKWLMGWVCTHKAQATAPQKISLENIQKFSGCSYDRDRNLKRDVIKALKELQEKATIQFWEFDKKNILSVVRPSKAVQP